MSSSRQEGDIITISRLDTRVLTALLLGPMNSYEIARQCEQDAGSNLGPVSNGGIQYSLKSLERGGFIKKIKSAGSRSGYAYKITPTGGMVLGWEVDHLKQIVKLVKERSSAIRPQPGRTARAGEQTAR